MHWHHDTAADIWHASDDQAGARLIEHPAGQWDVMVWAPAPPDHVQRCRTLHVRYAGDLAEAQRFAEMRIESLMQGVRA